MRLQNLIKKPDCFYCEKQECAVVLWNKKFCCGNCALKLQKLESKKKEDEAQSLKEELLRN